MRKLGPHRSHLAVEAVEVTDNAVGAVGDDARRRALALTGRIGHREQRRTSVDTDAAEPMRRRENSSRQDMNTIIEKVASVFGGLVDGDSKPHQVGRSHSNRVPDLRRRRPHFAPEVHGIARDDRVRAADRCD